MKKCNCFVKKNWKYYKNCCITVHIEKELNAGTKYENCKIDKKEGPHSGKEEYRLGKSGLWISSD